MISKEMHPAGKGLQETTSTTSNVRKVQFGEPNNLWINDAIEFPRLIAEIVATHDLNLDVLCLEMDLDLSELNELFERAESVWQKT